MQYITAPIDGSSSNFTLSLSFLLIQLAGRNGSPHIGPRDPSSDRMKSARAPHIAQPPDGHVRSEARWLRRLKDAVMPLSFEGYLLSYLCVLFVPVVLLAVVLDINYRKMGNDLYAQHAAALKAVQRTLDGRLTELSDFAEQFSVIVNHRFIGATVYQRLLRSLGLLGEA
jgi:hypothetical protein